MSWTVYLGIFGVPALLIAGFEIFFRVDRARAKSAQERSGRSGKPLQQDLRPG